MPFQKGHKYGGRKNPPGGRPTKNAVIAKKMAREIAAKFIEDHAKPILETYLGLAAGEIIKRETEDGKKEFQLHVDPATTRHALDKIIPPKQELTGSDDGPISISLTIATKQ